MAAFVDYTTRDRGVLGYRGFERSVMNDPDMKIMLNSAREIVERMVNPYINIYHLEIALKQHDINQLSNILGLSNEFLLSKINRLQNAQLSLRNKYPQKGNSIRSTTTTESDIITRAMEFLRKNNINSGAREENPTSDPKTDNRPCNEKTSNFNDCFNCAYDELTNDWIGKANCASPWGWICLIACGIHCGKFARVANPNTFNRDLYSSSAIVPTNNRFL